MNIILLVIIAVICFTVGYVICYFRNAFVRLKEENLQLKNKGDDQTESYGVNKVGCTSPDSSDSLDSPDKIIKDDFDFIVLDVYNSVSDLDDELKDKISDLFNELKCLMKQQHPIPSFQTIVRSSHMHDCKNEIIDILGVGDKYPDLSENKYHQLVDCLMELTIMIDSEISCSKEKEDRFPFIPNKEKYLVDDDKIGEAIDEIKAEEDQKEKGNEKDVQEDDDNLTVSEHLIVNIMRYYLSDIMEEHGVGYEEAKEISKDIFPEEVDPEDPESIFDLINSYISYRMDRMVVRVNDNLKYTLNKNNIKEEEDNDNGR